MKSEGGQNWTPITPPRGSNLHAGTQASDEEIFAIIERGSPDWISAEQYRDAITRLRTNSGAG